MPLVGGMLMLGIAAGTLCFTKGHGTSDGVKNNVLENTVGLMEKVVFQVRQPKMD